MLRTLRRSVALRPRSSCCWQHVRQTLCRRAATLSTDGSCAVMIRIPVIMCKSCAVFAKETENVAQGRIAKFVCTLLDYRLSESRSAIRQDPSSTFKITRLTAAPGPACLLLGVECGESVSSIEHGRHLVSHWC